MIINKNPYCLHYLNDIKNLLKSLKILVPLSFFLFSFTRCKHGKIKDKLSFNYQVLSVLR